MNTATTTIQYPTFRGHSIPDLVQAMNTGDRAHIELTVRDGEVRWWSGWVTDTGAEYFETERFRVEITDSEKTGHTAVTLYESQGGEYISERWTESINGLERVPREEIDTDDWYQWEVHVSEAMGGGVSTDQVVFPEAPSREQAQETAKRWAGIENGHIPALYQEDAIKPEP